MSAKKQKLELTWIGKGDEPKLEPRILIEDPEKSYGDPNTENILIHGDNLLALKALEQDFGEKVKCIYIDPPYNTGSAFEHYDDNLEHSIWLSLMNSRLKILHRLLDPTYGVLFVQIDYNELAYLKVLLDEQFGRAGYLGMFTLKVKAPSGDASKNKRYVYDVAEYILIYSKNPKVLNLKNKVVKEVVGPGSKASKQYGMLFINLGSRKSVSRTFHATGQDIDVYEMEDYEVAKVPQKDRTTKLYVENYEIIGRTAKFSGKMYDALKDLKGLHSFKYKQERGKNAGKVVEIFVYNGEQVIYLKDYSEITTIEDEYGQPTECVAKLEDITNIITEDLWQGIAAEGGVDFPKAKKPEHLLKLILEMSTKPGDIVLDSFLGSGTTAAVAHKMGRRWIGVELGEQAYTHCTPRLNSVVAGTDQSGVSKSVGWKGGGGYKFYEVAPSLLKQDDYGNWVISKSYDANMLAHAMAKQEGFTYDPSQTTYWQQGFSTEKDFIYTTTQYVSVELLDSIHSAMQSDESLLIACKAFDEACKVRYDNITIKKIPQILLGRCEFGKDDYSLNISEESNNEENEAEGEEE